MENSNQILNKILALIEKRGTSKPTRHRFNEYGCRFDEYELGDCRLDSTYRGGCGCFTVVVNLTEIAHIGKSDGADLIRDAIGANFDAVKKSALDKFLTA